MAISEFRLHRKNIGTPVARGSGATRRVVNLLPIDSSAPNLALEKVAFHYRAKGYEVISDYRRAFNTPTWVSVIFDDTKERAADLYDGEPKVRLGGSGWSLSSTLPQEIERINPKINFGFTTRGCVRRCKFCVVPRKEGKIHPVGDIYDVWDRKTRLITLLDNNILASPEHFKLIAGQLIREKLHVDFNQGLDIRLVNDQSAYLISKLSFPKFPRFALDSPSLIPTVRRKLRLLRKYKAGSRYFFYVLVGFNTTFEEDLERLNYLRAEGVQAFVMRYKKDKSDKMLNRLASWANSMSAFRQVTFEEYVRAHDQHNKHALDSPIKIARARLKQFQGDK